MEKIFEADGVPVSLKNLSGGVTLQIGSHDTGGHGIRRAATLTPGEARILAYRLLELAERHDNSQGR